MSAVSLRDFLRLVNCCLPKSQADFLQDGHMVTGMSLGTVVGMDAGIEYKQRYWVRVEIWVWVQVVGMGRVGGYGYRYWVYLQVISMGTEILYRYRYGKEVQVLCMGRGDGYKQRY